MNYINANELSKIINDSDTLIIDVRENDEFLSYAIENSINIPLKTFDENFLNHFKENNIILYCQSGTRSKQAHAKILTSTKNISQLEGGIDSWTKENKTISSSKKSTISIMRQVQMIAGSIILCGVILSQIIHPNWIYLSGFIGAGLLFAGISNWCGMAKLLAFLPWNKQN